MTELSKCALVQQKLVELFTNVVHEYGKSADIKEAAAGGKTTSCFKQQCPHT